MGRKERKMQKENDKGGIEIGRKNGLGRKINEQDWERAMVGN
jgi:hypothetical protein